VERGRGIEVAATGHAPACLRDGCVACGGVRYWAICPTPRPIRFLSKEAAGFSDQSKRCIIPSPPVGGL